MREHATQAFTETDLLGEELRATARVVPTDQLVIAFINYCEHQRNRAPTTVRTYTSTMCDWRDWLGEVHIFAASTQDMESFVNRRRRMYQGRESTRMGAPATRRREVTTLRSFYTWAWEQDYTTTHLAKALHAPTVHNLNPKPVPEHQWNALWGSDLTDGERCMLGLGYFGGLRRAEIASLPADCVGPTTLHGFIRKGGGDHTLPWAEMLAIHAESLPQVVLGRADEFTSAMMRLRRQREGQLLLPWLIDPDPQSINKRMARLQAKLDVAPFSPHQLRHSCATNLLRCFVPLHLVSRLMNHASTNVTMRYIKAGGNELTEWRRSSRPPPET